MSSLATDELGRTAPAVYLGLSYDIPIGPAANVSQAFGSKTTMVQLCGTVDSRIVISEAPNATPTSTLFPGGTPMVFATKPGWKVSVIQQSGAGSLSVTELL